MLLGLGSKVSRDYGFLLIDKAVLVVAYLGEHARNIKEDENSDHPLFAHLFRIYFQPTIWTSNDTPVPHESDSECSGGIACTLFWDLLNAIPLSTLLDDIVSEIAMMTN